MSAQWPWHPITAQSSLRWNIPLLRPDRQTIKRHVNKDIYLSRLLSIKNFILPGSFYFNNVESSQFISQSEQKWLNQQWLTLSRVPGQFLIFDTCSETTGAVAVYWGIWFGHNGDNGRMPSPGGADLLVDKPRLPSPARLYIKFHKLGNSSIIDRFSWA